MCCTYVILRFCSPVGGAGWMVLATIIDRDTGDPRYVSLPFGMVCVWKSICGEITHCLSISYRQRATYSPRYPGYQDHKLGGSNLALNESRGHGYPWIICVNMHSYEMYASVSIHVHPRISTYPHTHTRQARSSIVITVSCQCAIKKGPLTPSKLKPNSVLLFSEALLAMPMPMPMLYAPW